MAVARLSPTPPQVERPSGVDRMRWALAVGLVLLCGAALFCGERPTSLARLQAEVAAGHVTRVEVTPGLGPGETGYGQQQVRWRDGIFRYRTEVTQASPGVHVPRVDGTQVRRSEIGSLLSQEQPGLEVVRTHWTGSSSEVFGWGVPGWLSMLTIVEWLCCLGLVTGGPEPWRATRWAWFWLIWHPVGLAAFLLLSGRTPGVPRPRDGRRLLTGGWALTLVLVLHGVF